MSVMISARPRGAQEALGGLCGDVGGEHGRSAASTPLRASRPCAPFGPRLTPRGLTRPTVHAGGLGMIAVATSRCWRIAQSARGWARSK